MSSENGKPEGDRPNGLAGFLVPNPISGGIGKDIAIIDRAIKEGWDVPKPLRDLAVRRMRHIIKKKSVMVPQGPVGAFDSEAVADKNAIAATNTLLSMTGQVQADDHHADKLAQDDKHLALSAVELAARLGAEDLIALAIQTGEIDLLPKDLQAEARKRLAR